MKLPREINGEGTIIEWNKNAQLSPRAEPRGLFNKSAKRFLINLIF